MKKQNIGLEDLLVNIEENPSCFADYQYIDYLKERKIVLNATVESDIVETVVLPLLKLDNDGTGKPIELLIQCNGGSVWDSMYLCDIIDRMKTPLTITILGYALSMAALFAMAGHNNPLVKTVCYPFSIFLIHNGSIAISGDKKKVKETQEFNDCFDVKIKEYIIAHSNLTLEQYEEIEDLEYYLTAEKALELGIVDEIL